MRAADDAPHPSMKKEIIINAGKDRARIAIVEDGRLAELYVEHPDNVRTLGNIYLGKVAKVMPQIHAAFVDIGQRQDAFLHFSDLTENAAQLFAIAGEDIPGLESGPVLAHAPQKRVADDEDEPDVEETLEVEDAPEKSKTARTGRSRSRRRRRRGGRGRGRGRQNDSGSNREEEEEQEERRLPHVIDLTAKTGSVRPARKPNPSGDDTPEDASGDEAPADETPKRGRTRTPKSADAPDEPTAETDAPEASGDEPKAEAKPKRSRSRSRSKKKTEADTPETPEADAPEEAETADAEATDETEAKPKRSRSRSRKKKTETPDADASDDTPEATSGDDATDETAEETAEAKPKRSRSRSRSKKKDDAPSADADTPEASGDDTAEDSAEDTTAEEKASYIQRNTIDLTAPSKPRGRRRTPPQVDTDAPEASGDGEAEASDDQKSRSRGRGRGSSKGRSDDSPGDDPSDDAQEGGRSRRRRGGSRDDASGSDAAGDDRSASGDSDDDSADSRSRRGRGRNDDKSDDSRSRGGRSRSGGGRSGNGRSGGSSNAKVPTKPEELLKRGSRVLCKITKEPISSKGSRVSTDISLAGRFLVLVPAADYVAVSKKIESSKERRRLRALATSLKPDNCGVIVRTVAGGQDARALDQDLRLLITKWNKIEAKLDGGNATPPLLLHEDVDMVSSIIRDHFTSDFDRILIDDPRLHRKLQNYVKAVAPEMAERVVLHRSNKPIYAHCGIEKQVEEAFKERVNMKSGGYLIIEHTEAMHVVDVNSGRAGRGKRRAEENLLAVNMESAKEIARQLRLRDLGGIICVDFIDLRHERDRRKVTEVLRQEFKKDRAVTKVIGMSDFGVAQITRQRLRPSITAQDEDAPQDAMEAAGATAIPQPERDHPEPSPEASGDDRSDRGREDRGRDDRDRRGSRSDSGRGRGRRQKQGGRSAERHEPSESLSPAELSTRVRDWLAHYRDSVDDRYAKRPILVRVHPLLGSYMRRGFPSPLTRLRFRLRNVPFRVVEDQNVDPLSFQVNDEKSGRSLLSKYPLEG